MVIEVYMIKVVFIKRKVIFTKINEDFKLAFSWIITGNLFVMKDYFLEVYFSMEGCLMYFTLHAHIRI